MKVKDLWPLAVIGGGLLALWYFFFRKKDGYYGLPSIWEALGVTSLEQFMTPEEQVTPKLLYGGGGGYIPREAAAAYTEVTGGTGTLQEYLNAISSGEVAGAEALQKQLAVGEAYEKALVAGSQPYTYWGPTAWERIQEGSLGGVTSIVPPQYSVSPIAWKALGAGAV